ncbi:MAG TPA: hypothetical protein VKP30_13880 [Polyangiaceae bacterium]|nr:hypothetical protein [Polyangiaceae bacterium]
MPALASFVHRSWAEAHSVALDDNYVYWVATGVPHTEQYGFTDALIHRIAK